MENNNKRVVDNRQNINDDEKMKINMRAELKPSAYICVLRTTPWSIASETANALWPT